MLALTDFVVVAYNVDVAFAKALKIHNHIFDQAIKAATGRNANGCNRARDPGSQSRIRRKENIVNSVGEFSCPASIEGKRLSSQRSLTCRVATP